jgi:D-3-phosphoglycerate dehydrogenase
MADRPLVVITDSDLPSDADERLLAEAGLRSLRPNAGTEAALLAALPGTGAVALIVQWAPVSAAVLDAVPGCRFVSRLGIGYDMIDVAAATERGVAVANTPDYCVDEVVAHTLGMILWLVRGLGVQDAAVRAGRWEAAAYPAAGRPSQVTVGVVGLGRIGSRVAAQCAALGFAVLGHDPFAPAAGGVPLAPLPGLLAGSDVVTLHAPLNASTRHLISAEAIGVMRAGAVLVNTCRGGLVDEAALASALASGRLSGAALDVFDTEPLPAASRLRALPNVLLTPHAAWYSRDSLAELPVQAARQVVDFLAGRPVPSIVNPGYAQHRRAAAGRGMTG